VLTLESVPGPAIRQWDDDFYVVDAKSYLPFFIVDGQQQWLHLISGKCYICRRRQIATYPLLSYIKIKDYPVQVN
jgi:hypothetical protein